MAWIKRNLYFFIGSVIALVLLGLAGYFLYSKWDLNNQVFAKLNEAYEQVKSFNSLNPHPGYGQIDNTKIAKEQQQQIREYIKKSRQYFQRITPIPDVAKPTDQEFAAALSRTIAQLQRDADASSVTLPPNYNYSFEAQKQGLSFALGSLGPLSVQLGEVKAICDVLFDAKINALDAIRRERISTDDNNGPATDYLSEKSVTNELAILTPYEVEFRCFSSELASVLAGFGSSPYGLLVKTINVEVAPATVSEQPNVNPAAVAAPMPVAPSSAEAAAAAAFARRYGAFGGRYPGMPGVPGVPGVPAHPGLDPAYGFRPPPTTYVAPAPAPVSRGGLPTVLDERQLKITIALNVVKLLPAK